MHKQQYATTTMFYARNELNLNYNKRNKLFPLWLKLTFFYFSFIAK